MLTFGSKLPNGAIVIQSARRESDGAIYVLAYYRDEYVTWRYNPDTGDTSHGLYHEGAASGLINASVDLSVRAGLMKEV